MTVMPTEAGFGCKRISSIYDIPDENAVAPTLCRGGHEVQLCIYEEDLYHCSLCGIEIRRGTRFYSCRLCDFDICEFCSRGRTVASTYRLSKKLGQGSFGEVFKATDLRTGVEYAAKLERTTSKEFTLAHEAKVLQVLQGGLGIAKLMHFGKESIYNVMVMDLLGPSLEDLKDRFRTFSLVTVLMLAMQMIDRIEYLHKKGILHRDIKPDNFALGLHDSADVLHLIDFGLAKRYRDEQTSEHIPFRRRKRGLLGTPRYASINAHHGRELSRRDDLEAVSYVLVYLFKGKLPWQGLQCGGKEERDVKIGEMKRTIDVQVLCAGLPQAFLALMNYSRGCSFEQQPDYRYLREIFSGALVVEKERGRRAKFDWADTVEVLSSNTKTTANQCTNNLFHQQTNLGFQVQQPPPERQAGPQLLPQPQPQQQPEQRRQQDENENKEEQHLLLHQRRQYCDDFHEGEVADDNQLREFYLAGTVFERSTPAVMPGDLLPATMGHPNRPASLLSARTSPGEVAGLPKPGDRVRLKRPSRTRSGLLREGDVGVVVHSEGIGGASLKVKRGLAYDFYDADDIVVCQDSSFVGEPAPEPTPRGSNGAFAAPTPMQGQGQTLLQPPLHSQQQQQQGWNSQLVPPNRSSALSHGEASARIVSTSALHHLPRYSSMSSRLLAKPASPKRSCIICKKQFRRGRDVIQCRSCNFCICKGCSRRAECLCYQSLDQTRLVAQTKLLDRKNGAQECPSTHFGRSITFTG